MDILGTRDGLREEKRLQITSVKKIKGTSHSSCSDKRHSQRKRAAKDSLAILGGDSRRKVEVECIRSPLKSDLLHKKSKHTRHVQLNEIIEVLRSVAGLP